MSSASSRLWSTPSATRKASLDASSSRPTNSRSSVSSGVTAASAQSPRSASIAGPLCKTPRGVFWFSREAIAVTCAREARIPKDRARKQRRLIDICINNAIQFPSGGNTYAPTEGKCRFARGPSPAGAGPVGHGPVLHRLKWSPQKPETRAVERDQEAIERWKRKDWPRVKKTLGG